MAGIVRHSKYRHVFGSAARKDAAYEGFRVTNCAFEGTFIAANKKFVAACIETGGGGGFIVLPVSKTGRIDVNVPKVSGHKEYVLDMQWNPYDDNMLATCSEDGSIKIWTFSDSGPLMNMDDSKALLVLDYHERRCVQLAWHPIASNVLLSVSQEPKICVWNLDDGSAEVEIEHPEIIWNASWSMNGDKIVSSCKDKKFRIFNARDGKLLVEGHGHEGSKAQRVLFTFNDKYLFSTGFSKMSDRQYACWNAETLEELNLQELDTANGCLIPYYDADRQLVYIAAKGDSVIRYYELVDEYPHFHYVSTYQSSTPQRGLAPIPKRSVNPNIVEVFRFYKLCQLKGIGYIEPTSFTVPRKSDLFQEDVYPDPHGDVAAIEAAEWFSGTDAVPIRISMAQFFKGKASGKTEGGGLKKGGLKGLKAKKDAKVAAKATAKVESAPVNEPVKAEPKVKKEPEKVAPSESKVKPSSPPAASRSSGADAKLVKDLQNEVKTLKSNSAEMEAKMKALTTKLKDYDKLTADIKLLCDAVKKNDERIASLEALVQEESDNEA